MKQGELFRMRRDLENVYAQPDQAHARKTDPSTSHAAAASMKPAKLAHQRRLVYETLKARGPMTDWDLVNCLPGESPSGVRTRRKELASAGLVCDSGGKQRLPSGRAAIVWRVTGGSGGEGG